MKARRNHLIGRTIVAVDFGPFDNMRGGTAYAPRITLDNGRQLYFVSQETDTGDYGTKICITPNDKLGHGTTVKAPHVAKER